MISEAPPFWWTKPGLWARLLWPASFLYGRVARHRMKYGKRAAIPVPVVCVGNFTVGGAGKTPTAMALAKAAKRKGLKPGFLSRGYGGSLDVTTLVDLNRHRAVDVGDEPLLLAQEATTVVCRRRVEGAKRLVAEGVDVIIMDDGFQSARLAVDYALIVVDSQRGIGNGHVVPGGPVRAPIRTQLRHASALMVVGAGSAADRLVRQAARMGKGVVIGALAIHPEPDLAGRKVFAYAGIADPEKFFRTVEALGAVIAEKRVFGDHHHLSDDEIAELIADAARQDALLVTTAKDIVRLAGHHGKADELAALSRVITVEMTFDNPHAPDQILDAAAKAAKTRMLAEGKTA